MLTQSRMRSFRDGSLKLHCDTPFLSCSKSGLNHIAWEKRDAKKTQQSFPLLLSMFEVLVPPAICIGSQLASSSSLKQKKPSQLKHGKHGCRMNLVFCDDCMWPSQSFPENMFFEPTNATWTRHDKSPSLKAFRKWFLSTKIHSFHDIFVQKVHESSEKCNQ